jgi:sulfur-oxidizing protein SoxY
MTTRREFLAVAGGLAGGIGLAGTAGRAHATPESMREAIGKVTGGAPLRAGRVKLDIPPLVDNGNTVPLSVTVDSPMTPADHVKAIHVFTQKNPLPSVISAFFGPRAGRAGFSTRVRLVDTQPVVAIAQLSDGSFWSGSVDVVVTLSACLEEGLI